MLPGAEPAQLDKSHIGRMAVRKDFVQRTLDGLGRQLERSFYAEDLARAGGLLQSLDPRAKVIGLLMLLLSVALSRNVLVILAVFLLAVVLAAFSKVPIRALISRVWLAVLMFTGPIALPAIFITPGREVYRLPLLHLAVTAQGLHSALFLITRVETAVTLSMLLVLCTLWTHILKALSVLGVPVIFIVILGMTYRYIFLMLQTAHDMFESRRSRMIGKLEGHQARMLAAASVGVLLTKSFHLSNEVYLAMQSRGFRGEVDTLDEFQMQLRDWMAFLFAFLAAAVAFWFGLVGDGLFQ
jgi:cobalt ECF transporter T component CbiQ